MLTVIDSINIEIQHLSFKKKIKDAILSFNLLNLLWNLLTFFIIIAISTIKYVLLFFILGFVVIFLLNTSYNLYKEYKYKIITNIKQLKHITKQQFKRFITKLTFDEILYIELNLASNFFLTNNQYRLFLKQKNKIIKQYQEKKEEIYINIKCDSSPI